MRSAATFAALGDSTRLLIVALLCTNGPMTTARITAGTDVTRQAVNKHLQVLGEIGLVESERIGRDSVWQLRPERLGDARAYLDQIGAQWSTALTRFKAFLEKR